jgi:hypothetical protein
LPLAKQLGQAMPLAGRRGRIREVVQLCGVAPEVEKLGFVDLGIDNQLPPIVAKGPLDLTVGGEDRVADLGPISVEDRQKAEAFATFRRRHMGDVPERREDVEQISECVDPLAAR